MALLVDLSLRGRITSTATTVDIDPAPVGFAAANVMLRHIDANRGSRLGEVARSAKLSLLDVLDPDWRAKRRWGRRPFVCVDVSAARDERSRIEPVAESGHADSPATAALTIIAAAIDLVDARRSRAQLLTECATAAPLVADAAMHLDRLAQRFGVVTAIATTPIAGP